MAELHTGYVLFQNDTVQGLLARIIAIMGRMPKKFITESRLMKEYFTADMLLFQPDSDDKDKPSDNTQLMIPKRSNLKARLKSDDMQFVHFVEQLLQIDPEERPTAREAMRHPFLQKVYADGLNDKEKERLKLFVSDQKMYKHGD